MTPDLLPVVIATAGVVLLLVLGALRVAAGYRRVRNTVRRWGRTRLVLTHTIRRRKGVRR
ncbi:hypothetical protein A6A08_02015 [Nocardiopsis sp. TSRI0078]|uniref:hypothetical protein n=1 Tax=unclassified Nocardiopsis TaxID=2649073 RepID=UPI000939A2E7|nr:hypothetical protein [Nocardiopsis sp. TSRI0078]OKI23576.1 hypothetical protein A6A08_02015 [Nocardiopsis sp. TSRI0078]